LLPGRAVTEATIRDDLGRVIGRVGEASGIDFTVRAPVPWMRPDGTSLEGRIYCRGPRATPEAASIKIDLSLTEVVVRPPVLRQLSHPFPDGLPAPASVRCYSFEEVFAEKLRAMGGCARCGHIHHPRYVRNGHHGAGYPLRRTRRRAGGCIDRRHP
jgi:hypothetical protein